jgi:site-specific DNA-adenine methylase
MRPLFPFYGSKWRDAKRYPRPNGLVIEPFAGSAGYSTFWMPEKVKLFDIDPIIVAVWDYLIHVKPAEIRRLPDLEVGQNVDTLNLPQEARWLIGFWLNRGSAQPKKTKTAFSARTDRQQLVWSERARDRIAAEVEGVRDWTITHSSYADITETKATWFIDPPYVDKGRYYRFHDIDYTALGAWCLERQGQSIVCEQEGAAWMHFNHLASIKSTKGRSSEVVYLAGESTGIVQRPLDLSCESNSNPKETNDA